MAWWTADGDATDLLGAHDGAVQGGAGFATGKVERAFRLDGIDGAVLVPSSVDLNPTGPFSVDAWIQADPEQPSADHQFVVVDKSHGFTDGTGWAMQANPDGTMAFIIGKGGSTGDPANFVDVSTTSSIVDGQWHHLAGVFTGTELQIYLDGASDNTLAYSGAPANNAREVEIGRAWGGGTPRRYFKGLIDEVEYFDRSLTPEEVQAIFAAGAAGQCKPAPCEVPKCRDTDQRCKLCGQPISTGTAPTASDALSILLTAVGARPCRACVCDADGNGSIVATDALLTLERAVGQGVTLQCPAGPLQPTTTSTTSSTIPASPVFRTVTTPLLDEP